VKNKTPKSGNCSLIDSFSASNVLPELLNPLSLLDAFGDRLTNAFLLGSDS
jgi:hypothetical protein